MYGFIPFHFQHETKFIESACLEIEIMQRVTTKVDIFSRRIFLIIMK